MDRREDAAAPEPAPETAAQPAPEAAPAPAQPAAPAAPDLTAQLEQLAKLKEQGLISEADYESKKKQILGI
jgi:hypothetical protein